MRKSGLGKPALAKACAAPAAGPSTARNHARNPNPTPAATPPLAATANRRHGDSTQPAPARGRAKHSEPIDVDELYERKYSLKPEDLILPIDVATYRQSVRGKSKGKEREGEVEIVAQCATPAATETATAPRTHQATQAASASYDIPSTVGPAISAMKAYITSGHLSIFPAPISPKRALAAQQAQQTANPHQAKRRRVGEQDQRRQPPPPPPPQRHEQPIAGPSRLSDKAAPPPPAAARSTPHASGPLKRKPVAKVEDDDDVLIISDSSDDVNAARKRPKSTYAGAPSGQSQAPRSKPAAGKATTQLQTQAKRPHDVIELSSDGEVMEILSVTKKKKTKGTPQPSAIEIMSDSDNFDNPDFNEELAPSNYLPEMNDPPPIPSESDLSDDEDWGLPGMDLNDPDRWKPMPTNGQRISDNNLIHKLEQLDIAQSQPERVPPPLRCKPIDTAMLSRTPARGYTSGAPRFTWEKLAQAVNTYVPRRPLAHAYVPPSRHFFPPWNQEFGLHRLKRAFHDPSEFDRLKKAPGCINRIEQKGEWTMIASGCLGGLPDVPNEIPYPHNREGSLMTWNGHLDIPIGHQAKKYNPDRIKHYAVHDIKFDPLGGTFVSCGADHKVLLWHLYDQGEDPNYSGHDALESTGPRWVKQALSTFKGAPHELAFKPNSSILAIGEKKVCLYSLADSVAEERGSFSIHRLNEPHHIGAIAWGSDASSNHLFASSEPTVDGIFDGLHKAYDLQSKSVLYQFDAREAGDALCVGPSGSTLALSTRAGGNTPILRLYDIGRRDGRATATVGLERYATRHAGFEGEVNCSAFSPDGLFLALARNDGQTHVYDVRSLQRGPMYVYEHKGECRAASTTDRYGVVKAQWVQSARTRRIGLVTGGEDGAWWRTFLTTHMLTASNFPPAFFFQGCVRLWNPQISADNAKNGTVIAEVNSDVGHFSIGDPFAGEHCLVVGDCSGEIYFFDSII
ncbi:hypothetical protein HYPSUDRAFT_197622 [Hypholoma sublateritium FD-334 SS-4]|uniref:WD40 repeat-like protein n=1 Tax=Hypholoma sublateritium (strain FD-334 SS-4) TaxID=945553 RepID=A0A0D2LK31_HYPSF|nr:hypothetical protein HYPSUDRAFT_197622 [Hypholoma sublateritium FD-334 SS-4]